MFMRNLPPFISRRTVSCLVTSVLAIFLCFAQLLSGQQSETLTNADVIKMVQMHLGADVIVEQIRANAGNYVLSVASLSKLKQAGVPDKVIASMQVKKASATSAPDANAKLSAAKKGTSQPASPEESEGVWRIVDGKDDLKNQPFTEARTSAGPFEIRAQCKRDTYLALWLKPKHTGIELMRSAVPERQPGKILGEGRRGQLCAHMQVIAGEEFDYFSSYCDGGDQTSLVFVGENYAPELFEYVKTLNQTPFPLSGLIHAATEALGMQMSDLWPRGSLAIKAQLSDGSHPVIHLNLADQTFRNYYDSNCGSSGVNRTMSAGPATWTDPATGLMWEKDQEISKRLTWQQAMEHCQNLRLDGDSDWRLATIDELKSVFSPDADSSSLSQGFSALNAKPLLFNSWSSTPGNAPGEAWLFYVSSRHQTSARFEVTAAGQALCVRRSGPQSSAVNTVSPSTPSSTLASAKIEAGSVAADIPTAQTSEMQRKQAAFLEGLGPSGIWLDTRTNLMWMKQDNHHGISWQETEEYCSSLRLGGLSGWRMPSIDELRYLNGPLAASQLNPPIKVGTQSIWSSTTKDDKAWTDDPTAGFISTRPRPNRIGMRALCTRAYQPATDGQGAQ